MILTPAIIALMGGLLFVLALSIYSSLVGFRIIRSWDIRSGSETQLALERKTYLISSILVYVMAFELFSLFLFVYTVDNIHVLFVGAMCAAGTLNANSYGYSTLMVKLLTFFMCGIWLLLNYTDNLGPDYPLIKKKYRFLHAITALILIEAILQYRYFSLMEPNLITSCCGSLFSESNKGIAGDMAAIPFGVAKWTFFAAVLLALRVGLYCYATGKGMRLFSWVSGGFLIVSLVSIISFISVYYYELPTHHCPFCLLQGEYHYVGYALYISLFGGAMAGVGGGVIERYRRFPSLYEAIPIVQRRLCLAALIGYAVFSFIAIYPMITSSFSLTGY